MLTYWFECLISMTLHAGLLWMQYGFRISMVWLVKLVTDPFTDVAAYYPSAINVWTSPDWKTATWANFQVGPGRCCPPRHRAHFKSSNRESSSSSSSSSWSSCSASSSSTSASSSSSS